MTKSTKLVLAAAIIGLFASQPLFAQGPEEGPPNADFTMNLDGLGLPEAGGPPEFGAPPPPPPHVGMAGPAFMPPADGDFLIGYPPPPDVLAMGPQADDMIAQGPEGPGGPSGAFLARRIEFRGGGPLSNVTLSDEQLEKMFAIKKESAGKSASKFGELMGAEMNLQDLLMQPELDKTKILAAQARVNSLKADLANARLEDRISMLSVLTAEQRTDLRKSMLKRMGGGGSCPMGMGRRGGNNPCPGGPSSCPKKS